MLVVKSFTFSPIEENTYLLFNENRECCIIDPGCYFPEERAELKKEIENAGLKPVMLLNTHCHLDHVFGNQFVFETWGLELHLHRNEEQVLAFAPQSGLMYQLPFEQYTGPLHFLSEKEIVKIGKEELEVLFTPGHSPGSISFFHGAGEFVISGDALFKGSIGRTDLPGGNFDVLIESIRTNLFSLPESTKVYSGHGPETTIGVEKRTNPYLKTTSR